MTAEERQRAKARVSAAVGGVDRVVLVVAQVDGPDALHQVPTYPHSQSLAEYTHTAPRPLPGIAAAKAVQDAARQATLRFVRAAREAGHTWLQIGEALGLSRAAERADLPLGEAAHNWVITGAADGEGPYKPRSFHSSAEWAVLWTCAACGGLVRDQGPVEVHPADCEPGHGEDCSRLAADVAAHQRAWDEED